MAPIPGNGKRGKNPNPKFTCLCLNSTQSSQGQEQPPSPGIKGNQKTSAPLNSHVQSPKFHSLLGEGGLPSTPGDFTGVFVPRSPQNHGIRINLGNQVTAEEENDGRQFQAAPKTPSCLVPLHVQHCWNCPELPGKQQFPPKNVLYSPPAQRLAEPLAEQPPRSASANNQKKIFKDLEPPRPCK